MRALRSRSVVGRSITCASFCKRAKQIHSRLPCFSLVRTAQLRKEEPDGHWACISQGAGLIEQQNRERIISKLKGLQRQIFDAFLQLRESQPHGSDYWEVAEHLGWGADARSIDRVRRPVEALCGRGLVMEMPLKPDPDQDRGRPRLRYRVRQAVADLCREGFSGFSGLSDDGQTAPETQNHDPLRGDGPINPDNPENLRCNGSGDFQDPSSRKGELSNSPLITENDFMDFLDSPSTQCPAENGHYPTPDPVEPDW